MKFGALFRVSTYEDRKKPVLECERLGFDTLYLADHLLLRRSIVPYAIARVKGKGLVLDAPTMETWTLITALARDTTRIRLGTFVLNNCFRHPSLLAKMAVTLDHISGGRLVFGLGMGYNEPEFVMYGFPYPKYAERARMLEEALQIIRMMWTEERPSYSGKYYSIKEMITNPKPLQKPHPPILVGGRGTATLKIAAKFADIWNWPNSNLCTPELYEKTLEELKKHCKSIKRDPEKIVKSLGTVCHISRDKAELKKEVERFKPKELPLEDYMKHLIGTPDEIINKIRRYQELGVSEIVPTFPSLSDGNFKCLQLFAETVISEFG